MDPTYSGYSYALPYNNHQPGYQALFYNPTPQVVRGTTYFRPPQFMIPVLPAYPQHPTTLQPQQTVQIVPRDQTRRLPPPNSQWPSITIHVPKPVIKNNLFLVLTFRIQNHLYAEDYTTAIRLYSEMCIDDPGFTEVEFHSMGIKAYASMACQSRFDYSQKKSAMKKGWMIFNNLKESGATLKLDTYKAVFSLCSVKFGNYDKHVSVLYSEMIGCGIRPDANTFNILFRICALKMNSNLLGFVLKQVQELQIDLAIPARPWVLSSYLRTLYVFVTENTHLSGIFIPDLIKEALRAMELKFKPENYERLLVLDAISCYQFLNEYDKIRELREMIIQSRPDLANGEIAERFQKFLVMS
jgi:hypothetical protein